MDSNKMSYFVDIRRNVPETLTQYTGGSSICKKKKKKKKKKRGGGRYPKGGLGG